VINKSPGMVVHPGPGHADDTISDWLASRLTVVEGYEDEKRRGIVHRLDKETSGLLLCAKDPDTEMFLKEQFAERSVEKFYTALVEGKIFQASGSIDLPVGRHPTNRKKQWAGIAEGREALTEYEVSERFEDSTLVRIQLHTGRTHQIRVHFSQAGHAVIGDRIYQRSKPNQHEDFLFLTSTEISFNHPEGERMHYQIELPDFFKTKLSTLKPLYREL
jgi:23S rRNA pseudouridine1911/1915/1917 synthase